MQQLRSPAAWWPLVLLAAVVPLALLASSGPVQWMDNGQYLAAAAQGRWLSEGFGRWDQPLFQTFSTLVHAVGGSTSVSLANALLLVPLGAAIYWLARTVAVPQALALAATALALFAHGVFWHATKVDSWLLQALAVLLAYAVHLDQRLRLNARQRLLAIGVLSGLAGSVHPLAWLVLLPLFLQLPTLYRAQAGWALLGALLGFSPAWPAVAHELASGLNPWQVARHYATGYSPLQPGSGREGELLRFDLMWHEKNAVTILLLSLMGPQVFGVLLRPTAPRQRLLWWALLLNLVAAASYNVFDRFAYTVPGVAMACILGMPRFAAWLPRNAVGRLAFNTALVAAPLALLSVWGLYSGGVLKLPTHAEGTPYRDDIHYLMVPYLRDRSAMQFAAYYEQNAPYGALIIADETPFGALRAAQADGQLQGRVLEWCGSSADLGPYVRGPGAYLPRTSFCERVVAGYRLDKQGVGYQLQHR